MTTDILRVKQQTVAKEAPIEQLRLDLLQPWPRITLRATLTLLFLIGLFLWGVNGTNARPGELLDGIPNILDFIRRLFPPRFDLVALPLALPAFSLLGSQCRRWASLASPCLSRK